MAQCYFIIENKTCSLILLETLICGAYFNRSDACHTLMGSWLHFVSTRISEWLLLFSFIIIFFFLVFCWLRQMWCKKKMQIIGRLWCLPVLSLWVRWPNYSMRPGNWAAARWLSDTYRWRDQWALAHNKRKPDYHGPLHYLVINSMLANTQPQLCWENTENFTFISLGKIYIIIDSNIC